MRDHDLSGAGKMAEASRIVKLLRKPVTRAIRQLEGLFCLLIIETNKLFNQRTIILLKMQRRKWAYNVTIDWIDA